MLLGFVLKPHHIKCGRWFMCFCMTKLCLISILFFISYGVMNNFLTYFLFCISANDALFKCGEIISLSIVNITHNYFFAILEDKHSLSVGMYVCEHVCEYFQKKKKMSMCACM